MVQDELALAVVRAILSPDIKAVSWVSQQHAHACSHSQLQVGLCGDALGGSDIISSLAVTE